MLVKSSIDIVKNVKIIQVAQINLRINNDLYVKKTLENE